MAAITKFKKSSIKSITYVYQLVYIRNYRAKAHDILFFKKVGNRCKQKILFDDYLCNLSCIGRFA